MSRQVGAIPNVLSIAGSDPSGGAGVQADLKTFAALGCHGMAVITALTAQNTRTVSGVHLPPAAFVAEQIATLAADIDVAAIKIGMLGSAEIAAAVAASLDRFKDVPVVLDPVLVATSGAVLGDGTVADALRAALFPRATLVTPNLAEAALLAGLGPLGSPEAVEAAARELQGGSSDGLADQGRPPRNGDRGRFSPHLQRGALVLGTASSHAQYPWHRLHAVVGHRRVPREG